MPDHSMIDHPTAEKLDAFERHLNYMRRYDQMQALTAAYRDYRLRNMILEDRLKADLARGQRPLNVLYYVYLLDQANYPMMRALQADDRFRLRVLVQHPAQLEPIAAGGFDVQLVHSKWDANPEHRPENDDPFDADLCFAEMPYGVLPSLEEALRPWMVAGDWMPKYRDIFPISALNSALFCLVHYAYFLADAWLWLKANPDLNPHYGLPFPNFAWLYFLESQDHLKYALDSNYTGNTSNYVVSGYPKYDSYLLKPERPDSFAWQHAEGTRKRVVYAPHFKRSEATLEHTCKALLALADSDRYEIVFKPHPNHNKTVNTYAPLFQAHPNAQTVRHNDGSQYIFATADLAIISSVSMHADGLFAGIPFISELPAHNFNHIGRKVQSVAYISDGTSDLRADIEDILIDGNDPKRAERDALRRQLATPGLATQNVVSAITTRLGI